MKFTTDSKMLFLNKEGEIKMTKSKTKEGQVIERKRREDAKMIEEDTKIWKEFRKYH